MNRHIAYPDIDIPIKQWWAGHYDHVFIAPSPFFRLRSANRDETSDAQYDPVMYYADRPDDFDDQVKRFGEPIAWHTIHRAVAPDVPKAEFYLAIWLLSCLGFDERANIPLQKKIDAYCEANRIYLPDGDIIPEIMHPIIKTFLHPFDGLDVVMYDEFREHSAPLSLSSLGADVPAVTVPNATTLNGPWAIHVPNPGILITTAHGSAAALIAMTEEAYALSDPAKFFECEPVDETTYCDWLNPKDFFKRKS
jgi:hypothetical protein